LRFLVSLCVLALILVSPVAFAEHNVEVRLNGGADVAYIGESNLIEVWLKNSAQLNALSLSFEFTIGRDYQFNPGFGDLDYGQTQAGLFLGQIVFIDVVPSIDHTSPDTARLGIEYLDQHLPVNDTLVFGLTMEVYIPEGQSPLEDGFCIDNVARQFDAVWSYLTDSGGFASVSPNFQGNPNNGLWDASAPPVCFDIIAGAIVCGDSNGDGSGPDIADLVHMVAYMFEGGPAPPRPVAIDLNGDGTIGDIADLVFLVSYMFAGGPAPGDTCHSN